VILIHLLICGIIHIQPHWDKQVDFEPPDEVHIPAQSLHPIPGKVYTLFRDKVYTPFRMKVDR
jgi:hypothetical protein